MSDCTHDGNLIAVPDDAYECKACSARYNRVLELPSSETYEDMGSPYESLKDVKQAQALRALLHGAATIRDICYKAGISYATWYRWRNTDAEFEDLYQRTLAALAGELEPELMARAKESDVLMMFALKSWKPERYREKQTIEVVSPDVQSRLSQQADAIMEACRASLPADQAATVASKIGHRLRQIWVGDDERRALPALPASGSPF